jgi:hypothetical protein
LISGVARVFTVAGSCGIPADAEAIALNLTVITPSGNGNLVLYPGNGTAPLASLINFAAGLNRANNAIVRLATDGAGTIGGRSSVAGGGGVDIVIDVVGYFK